MPVTEKGARWSFQVDRFTPFGCDVEACAGLWCHVLLSALHEIKRSKIGTMPWRELLTFFDTDNEMFVFCCAIADLNPETVLIQVNTWIDWRMENDGKQWKK